VKELSLVFPIQISSTTTTLPGTGIECERIEIPFQSSGNNEVYARGSIVVDVPVESFPEVGPQVSVVTYRLGGQMVVHSQEMLEKDGVLRRVVWGRPNVRLATIVSGLWYGLGCMDSPRKMALRKGLHQGSASPTRVRSRLPVAFEREREVYSKNGSIERGRYQQYDDAEFLAMLGIGEELDGLVHLTSSSLSLSSPPHKTGDNDNTMALSVAMEKSIECEEVMQRIEGQHGHYIDPNLVVGGENTSNSLVERLLNDVSFLGPLQERLQATQARRAVEDVRNKNDAMLSDIESLRQHVAILKAEYNSKLGEYREKNAKQERLRSVFAPEVLVGRLQASAVEVNERGARVLEDWKSGDLSHDKFIKEYVDVRAEYHARSLKAACAVQSIPMPKNPSLASPSSTSAWR
jgi:hypothetical protein